MQENNILIVEDEIVTINTLKDIFLTEGYNVYSAQNEDELSYVLNHFNIDLILIDINLSGKNGLAIAREKLSHKDIPFIFLTGRDDQYDKILGLEIGADDYITKPFNIQELTIRVRNVLNRFHNTKEFSIKTAITKVHKFNNWIFDLNKHTLTSPTEEVFKLPKSEYKILNLFCEKAHTLISRNEIFFEMTGKELKQYDRTVDVTIRKLRQKFETVQGMDDVITTIHGEGYMFLPEFEIQKDVV